MGSISQFIERHFRHFNAAALKDAADAYIAHLDRGGKMMITLAGAMSTAELGLSLAEMIRQDKVHAITCTGANLEEDLFNLVARSQYERIPRYRELTAQHEEELLRRHLNRVTDTCIPEEEAIRRIERVVINDWIAAAKRKERFPARISF
jgi:deoxyhypusine synthase